MKWLFPVETFGPGVRCDECGKYFEEMNIGSQREIGILIGAESNKIKLQEYTPNALLCMECVKKAYDLLFGKI